MKCIINALLTISIASIYSASATTRFNPSNDVVFHLYTKANNYRSQILTLNDNSSFVNSNINPNQKTIYIIHGFRSNFDDEYNNEIRKAIFDHVIMEDYNVFSVDWMYGADGTYEESVENVPIVAKQMHLFISWLNKLGLDNADIRVVGFSLGAQISGYLGRGLDGKLPFLMGLDPADRLFEETSIIKSDAQYVEIIHTSTIGIRYPNGHNDFYPNKGQEMPGCDNDAGCSHSRSFKYFAESLKRTNDFKAVSCANLTQIDNGHCEGKGILFLGGLEAKDVHGLFFLETNSNPPYAKG